MVSPLCGGCSLSTSFLTPSDVAAAVWVLAAGPSSGFTSIQTPGGWEGPGNLCFYQVPWLVLDAEVPPTRNLGIHLSGAGLILK